MNILITDFQKKMEKIGQEPFFA